MVRHGETDWNRERRFQGHADVPLNESGRAQVRALAGDLAGESFAAAYTSPLRRAAESAEILAAMLRIDVQPSEALREVDVGSWSGLTVAEVQERYPEGFARWIDWRCEGWEDGEAYEDFSRRVAEGLRELGSRHPGEQVLAVTHGGPIRAAWATALRLPLDEVRGRIAAIENCATVRIAVRDGILEQVD
jgi:probable phosphoglycerate mutase